MHQHRSRADIKSGIQLTSMISGWCVQRNINVPPLMALFNMIIFGNCYAKFNLIKQKCLSGGPAAKILKLREMVRTFLSFLKR